MFEPIEVPKVKGYVERKSLNIYERQLESSWAGDKMEVPDLIDGWVRTVAVETDLKESEVDRIVEQLTTHIVGRYDMEISPFAAVDEIREEMKGRGLTP